MGGLLDPLLAPILIRLIYYFMTECAALKDARTGEPNAAVARVVGAATGRDPASSECRRLERSEQVVEVGAPTVVCALDSNNVD